MNIDTVFNGININVKFNKGITYLRGYSGTGKTLLLSAVELYCRNQDIRCYLFDYHVQDLSKEQICVMCSGMQVLLLDNADLYLTPDLLRELQCASYVIISMKNLLGFDLFSATSCLVHYNNRQLTLEEF